MKLIVEEPESSALAEAIRRDWPYVVSSEVISVECHRAALRLGGEARRLAVSRLAAVGLLELTPDIRRHAEQLGRPALRALDAIHLATALTVADHIGAVLVYDARLADAARAEGLHVLEPG